jgi:hypothetical protein
MDAFVLVPGGEPFSGIVWVQQPKGFSLDVSGLDPCGDLTPDDGDYEVGCFRVAGGGDDGGGVARRQG